MKPTIQVMTLAAAALAAWVALGPAQALTLKRTVTVGDDVVRVSDFFGDAEHHGQTALFRAPDAGTSGVVSASRLREAVYRLGMSWLPPGDVGQITVTRLAGEADREVPVGEIETALASAIAETMAASAAAPGGITVTLGTGNPAMMLSGPAEHTISITAINADAARDEFEASVEITQGESVATYKLSGEFERYYDVPMLAAPVARGQIVSPDLVATTRMSDPGAGILVNAGEVVGLAARRNLRAGMALRAGDLEQPKLVTRNQLVTVVFAVPGMVLTTQGRALGDGALGESVAVLNVRSNRIVQAKVETYGRVSVGDGATRVAMQ